MKSPHVRVVECYPVLPSIPRAISIAGESSRKLAKNDFLRGSLRSAPKAERCIYRNLKENLKRNPKGILKVNPRRNPKGARRKRPAQSRDAVAQDIILRRRFRQAASIPSGCEAGSIPSGCEAGASFAKRKPPACGGSEKRTSSTSPRDAWACAVGNIPLPLCGNFCCNGPRETSGQSTPAHFSLFQKQRTSSRFTGARWSRRCATHAPETNACALCRQRPRVRSRRRKVRLQSYAPPRPSPTLRNPRAT